MDSFGCNSRKVAGSQLTFFLPFQHVVHFTRHRNIAALLRPFFTTNAVIVLQSTAPKGLKGAMKKHCIFKK